MKICENCDSFTYKDKKFCLKHYRIWKKEYDKIRYENKTIQSRHKSFALKRTYGISYEDYIKLKNQQNNLCKICKKPEKSIRKKTGKILDLSVDHDHNTGCIRGLLCTKCNRGIGNFDNNPDFLLNASKYLRKEKI